MKIYSMTATFGKLEHETLTLKPGLNILHAPNEWGKSTWCAFLAAMLYGLDTRAKSTKTALADKERYAPWSGSPMAGRMDLSWQGRDITIERKTKGRVPMGDFRAYETATGLEVPELTAANCGQTLLGVEKSVFLRSAFLRLSDLPVTDDEALRRRLNALVTTGDESSGGERLAKGLKEQKNRIRYNRTGLLPQAEAERSGLEKSLEELEQLEVQSDNIRERLVQLEQWQAQLENHQTALAYQASREDARRVSQAHQQREEAAQRLAETSARCEELPEQDTAEQVFAEIRRLQETQQTLQMELQMLLLPETAEETPPFAEMGPAEAIEKAMADRATHFQLSQHSPYLLVIGILLALTGGAAAFWYPVPGLICAGLGAVLLLAALVLRDRRAKQAKALEERYGSADSDEWVRAAEAYAARVRRRQQDTEEYRARKQSLEQQLKELNTSIRSATQDRGLEECRADWEQVLRAWDEYCDARRDWQRCQEHYETLLAMAKPAPAPEFADEMDYSPADTARLLSDCVADRRRLENILGQYQGRMESLGGKAQVRQKLDTVSRRIAQLEETYAALTIAQETLAEATAELQRRFAPRIAARAQSLLSKLTAGRYDRLVLSRDLSLQAGTGQEDTLREALWRSDGTVDQLYLALRLAVSEELAPGAPLVLDDALVRFDDARLKAALEILKEEAKQKQILLFSCQRRELDML